MNIWTKKRQIKKMHLDNLLTDIFHVVTCCRLIFYAFGLGQYLLLKTIKIFCLSLRQDSASLVL